MLHPSENILNVLLAVSIQEGRMTLTLTPQWKRSHFLRLGEKNVLLFVRHLDSMEGDLVFT